MAKVKVSLATLGHLPRDLDLDAVRSWRSDIFEIVEGPASYAVTRDSDAPDWAFSDDSLAELLPTSFEGDFLFAIASVPLEDNYYARRIPGNRAVVTLHEIADYLRSSDIPLENGVLRLLYSSSMVFQRFNGVIPPVGTNNTFTHDETRGCIFDMNGYKPDIVASCDGPRVCEPCTHALTQHRVPTEVVRSVQKELSRIRKPLYFRLADWVRAHPLLALIASLTGALIVGVSGSLIASFIYAALTNS